MGLSSAAGVALGAASSGQATGDCCCARELLFLQSLASSSPWWPLAAPSAFSQGGSLRTS